MVVFDLPPKLWLPPKPAIIRAWKREAEKASFLPGMFPFVSVPAAGGAPTLSFRGATGNDADLTTYTFSSHDIGDASATRHVIVAVHGGHSSSSVATVSSVTVGGVGATELATVAGSAGNLRTRTAIWIAAVPTGTTADIVVTFSAQRQNAGVGVWAAYDLSSATAVATATSIADPSALSVNTSAGGIVIAAVTTGAAAPNLAWTGISERYDIVTGVGGQNVSGGDASEVAAETPRTVSGDYTSSFASAGCSVSLR